MKSVRIVSFYILAIGVIGCGTFFSCAISRQGRSVQQEFFDTFYEHFHRDSIFQISRLAKPLGGYRIEGTKLSEWASVPWVMHKRGKGQIDESVYSITAEKQLNRVREKITIPNSTFLIERNFECVDGSWLLVYCLEIFL